MNAARKEFCTIGLYFCLTCVNIKCFIANNSGIEKYSLIVAVYSVASAHSFINLSKASNFHFLTVSSSILKVPEKIISIKATSNEKIGFIGDGLGIAAESIVQISNEKTY